jgi:hypothetical protein
MQYVKLPSLAEAGIAAKKLRGDWCEKGLRFAF